MKLRKSIPSILSEKPNRFTFLNLVIMAMFTLYRIVKRSVAESVPDKASVHTRTAAFETVSAPEQYCSAPLLKVGLCSHCTG